MKTQVIAHFHHAFFIYSLIQSKTRTVRHMETRTSFSHLMEGGMHIGDETCRKLNKQQLSDSICNGGTF